MFDSLLIHDIVLFRTSETGAEDRYGDSVESWDLGTAVRARVDALSVGGASREVLVGRDTRKAWYVVFMRPDVDVTGLDVIEWQGKRLLVDGVPSLQYDGMGPHHWEVACTEVQG